MGERDAGDVGREVERASRDASRRPWVRALARAGFFSRAAVYAVIGGLALAVALGRGGEPTDSRGALAEIAAAPLGGVAVGAVGVGLAGLSLWFLVAAAAGLGARPGWKGVRSRLAKAFVAILYGGLAFTALRLLAGDGPGEHGTAAARSWTARALALPGGQALVLAAGLVVAFIGVRQIRRGARRRFTKDLDLGRMRPALARLAVLAGTAGFVTQGTVLAAVGGFLLKAAFTRSPRHAAGFDGALAAIARQPSGATLLAAAALGLLAYAAFAAVEGRYRRLSG